MFKSKSKETQKVRVLFIDQKNDYVSQIAEHFTKQLFSDLYEAYSAGPEKDFVDCELISSMYDVGEDMRTAVSKDFKDKDYLREDQDYDFVVFMQQSTFDEWKDKTPWKGKQIIAPMRMRSEYTATDDLELYQDYIRSMEEVREWVRANMKDPENLKSLVSA